MIQLLLDIRRETAGPAAPLDPVGSPPLASLNTQPGHMQLHGEGREHSDRSCITYTGGFEAIRD